METVLCKKCESELYEINSKGGFWDGEISSVFDEERIKVEGFDFSYYLSEGYETGATTLKYSCKKCEEKGEMVFWGGGQAKIGYDVD